MYMYLEEAVEVSITMCRPLGPVYYIQLCKREGDATGKGSYCVVYRSAFEALVLVKEGGDLG